MNDPWDQEQQPTSDQDRERPTPVYGQGSFDEDPLPKRRRDVKREEKVDDPQGLAPGLSSERSPEPMPRPQPTPPPMQPGPQPQGGWQPQPPQPYKQKPHITSSPLPLLLSILVTFILTAGFFIGFIWMNIDRFAKPTGSTNTDKTDPKTEQPKVEDSSWMTDPKLTELIQNLKDNYYRELTDEEILEAVIKGLPSNLDSPYTYYMTPEDFEAMNESIEGEYSGIGASVQMVEPGIYEIVEPTPKSPADEAGLKPGDRFIKVNDIEAHTFPTVADLANAVKGETGSKVKLELFRPSSGETLTVELERKPIVSHPVNFRMLEDDLGYMQIREFSLNLPEEFQVGMRQLIADGAKSVVFDMRNNPGGAAAAATKVLDYLLPKGTIATVKGRQDGQETHYEWTSDDAMFVPEDMKFIILVNRNSASASELFTGSLRDWDKAHIIGEQTFGKGSGTVAFKLKDGSAVNVTIFNYYLPKGELIEGVGIAPHEEVSLSEEAQTKIISELTLEEDSQLQAAIDYWHSVKK